MLDTQSTKFFKLFDRSNRILEKNLNLSYLEAFVKSGSYLLNPSLAKEDHLSSQVTDRLQNLGLRSEYRSMGTAAVHRAIQFVMLRAMKEDRVQTNHQLTPDIIAFVMGYVMIRPLKAFSHLKLLDLTAGTGNLLMTVVSQLKRALKLPVSALGIDNNDTLVKVAKTCANLQKVSVKWLYRDAVTNFSPGDFNLAISDLPVGYYPLDRNTKSYATRFQNGHSYAHYLLIEQAMRHVSAGGFGEFLVPSSLFNTTGAKHLLRWMQSQVYLQGVLNLPQELFASRQTQKAILLLQKPGAHARQAKRVMIGEFPSFKKPTEFQKFIAEIVEWEEHDLLK